MYKSQRGVSIADIRSIVGCDIFAMLLRTYIDDSADQTQEKAIVAGAYVGFYHQWNELQKRWRKRLKQDGLEYFRAAEYYSLRGQFSKYRNELRYPKPSGSQAAQAVLDDLEMIIHKTQVMGVAVCIDMQAYRRLREAEPHADAILSADPFHMALQSVVHMCAEIARDEFTGKREVAFVCDDSDSSALAANIYVDFKKNNPALSPFLGALVHQDDKKQPPLQTADMMAHLARRRFIDWLVGSERRQFTTDKAMQSRLKRLNVHKIGVWTREYMLAVIEQEKRRRGLG